MTKKSTKRALALSLVSLLTCVSMFVGSTFAWFTDTATTNVNTILAGNLNVELLMSTDEGFTDAEGKTLNFVDQDKNSLWEPGVTYNLPNLKIKNNGSLALKYKVLFNAATVTKNLSDVIEVKVDGKSIGTLTDVINNAVVIKTGSLAPTAESTELAISFHMMESAGNTYQDGKIDNMSVTVLATQDTVEKDSISDQYDTDAKYPETVKKLLAAGGNVEISESVVVTDESTESLNIINKDTTVDFGNNVITLDLPNATGATDNWKGLDIREGNVVLNGNEGGVVTADNGELYAVMVGNKASGTSANVTINGGKYVGGTTSINVVLGTVTINGGFFEATIYTPNGEYDDGHYTLNCYDTNYKNGTANIIVKGGTFVNFNPANNKAEGIGTNFVAEGYKVISETQANGDIWYTVVAE